MTELIWVKPIGPRPSPGTKLRVELQQDLGGRPVHHVGKAEVYEGGRALLKLTESSVAGREAVELLKEECLDAVFWGSAPTLRLRG